MVGTTFKTLALAALLGGSFATPALPRGTNHYLRRVDERSAAIQARHLPIDAIMRRHEEATAVGEGGAEVPRAEGAEAPKAEGEASKAEGEGGGEATGTESAAPCTSSACGKAEGGKAEEGKTAEGEAHKEGGEASKPEGEAGKEGEHKAEGEAPKAEGEAGKEGEAPKAEGEAHGAEGEAPKAEGGAHGAEGEAPKAEGEAHKPEGEAPKKEGEAHKPEGEAPKKEGEAHKPEGEAPKKEGEAHKPEGEAPKKEGEAHKPEGEAPKKEGEALPMHGSGSEAQTPLDMCLLSCSKQFGGASLEGKTEAGAHATEGQKEEHGATATEGKKEETAEEPSKTVEGGGGATHTVIVAPTKGVLRYVPFAVDAKPGDKILYMWGAGPHTVTSSNGLSVCNKSLDTTAMVDSGKQNATFSMPVSVSDTNATFRYCSVAGHCQKGMFGVVNPPAAPGGKEGSTSIAVAMSGWANSSAEAGAMVAAVQNNAAMTPEAWAWGASMDTSIFSGADMPSVMANVLYTRMTVAMNPGMMQGNVNMASLKVPEDVSVLASANGNGGSTSQAASATAAEGTAASAESSPGAKTGAGFRSIAVSASAGLATLSAVLFLMI